MALAFPSSPTLYQTTTTGGQTWTWNGNNWYVSTSGGGGASVTVANSAPNSPADGSLWLNSDSGVFSVFYNTSNVWLGFVGGGSSGGGTSLPSFTGNTGKFLTNDGTVSSWGNVTIPSVTASAVSDQLNTSTGYFSLPTGNTAQRPGTPVTGATRINSETNYFETYYNSNWFNLTYIGLIIATGGVVTTSGSYKIHTFITTGNLNITASPTGATYEILIVGGGGGSGGYSGGGGGGEVLYSANQSLNTQTYLITVGGGGPNAGGANGGDIIASHGTASAAFGESAKPGGGGKGSDSTTTPSTTLIANGGGGGSRATGYAGALGTNVIRNFTRYGGYTGGSGKEASNYPAGGGAGAAGNGITPASGGSAGGNGGPGVLIDMTGSALYWAGGGAGMVYYSTTSPGNGAYGGNGGSGGGGGGWGEGGRNGTGGVGYNVGGDPVGTVGGNGGANTGGGGGAGAGNTSGGTGGGNGGSGIVIIRYRI